MSFCNGNVSNDAFERCVGTSSNLSLNFPNTNLLWVNTLFCWICQSHHMTELLEGNSLQGSTKHGQNSCKVLLNKVMQQLVVFHYSKSGWNKSFGGLNGSLNGTWQSYSFLWSTSQAFNILVDFLFAISSDHWPWV